MTAPVVDLDVVEARAEWLSSQRKAAWRAKPRVRIWNNPPDGQESRGLILRAELRDSDNGKVTFSRRKVTTATVRLRLDHYVFRWLANLPKSDAKNGVVLTVDHMGSTLRWSGLFTDWHVRKDGFGVYFAEITFTDDRQYLQTLMGAPNPLLPLWLIQFPRVLPGIGPSKWICSMFILLNLIRVNNAILSFPDDPFDWSSYEGIFDWSTWQCFVVAPKLLEDSSLWTVISTRMDPLEAVFEETLDMAQLSVQYRRVLTVDGEDPADYGLDYVDSVRNGALILEIVDNSGFYNPEGTAFGGALVTGLYRSAIEFANGFVEEYVGPAITDDPEVWPDEYYQNNTILSGWLPVPTRPNVIIRDSKWSQVETADLGYEAAGPVAAIVGGDNQYVDTMAELTIQAVGNILGYMALGGFSSAGDIAATVIMPFLRGTIGAWLYWKNMKRAQDQGWVHLYEKRGGSGDMNAWTLSSVAALTGTFADTKAKTVHQFTMSGAGPHYPGIDFLPGHRIASTAEKIMPGMVHVDAVEEISLEWDYTTTDDEGGHHYGVIVGTGEVAMSFADKFANTFAKSLDTLNQIGVRLVS